VGLSDGKTLWKVEGTTVEIWLLTEKLRQYDTRLDILSDILGVPSIIVVTALSFAVELMVSIFT